MELTQWNPAGDVLEWRFRVLVGPCTDGGLRGGPSSTVGSWQLDS